MEALGEWLAEVLVLFPLPSGFLSCEVANLTDVAPGPLLLVLLFAALEVVRNAAVNDLVASLEEVLLGISWFGRSRIPMQRFQEAIRIAVGAFHPALADILQPFGNASRNGCLGQSGSRFGRAPSGFLG